MATPRESKVPYPVKKDFKTFYLYKEGKCIFKGNEQELFKSPFSENCHSIIAIRDKFIMEVIVDTDAFKKAIKAYYDEQQEIHDEFMQNVIEEEGFYPGLQGVNHLIFEKAWENGHSSGYDCVQSEFAELVGFAKEIIDIYEQEKIN